MDDRFDYKDRGFDWVVVDRSSYEFLAEGLTEDEAKKMAETANMVADYLRDNPLGPFNQGA